MAAKVDVRGANPHPFYRWAAAERPLETPRWNFHKYLIGRDGRIAAVFATNVEPMDARVVNAIAKELPRVSRTDSANGDAREELNASHRRGDAGRVSAMILSAEHAAAADIRVLSVGSVQIATKALAPEFEKATGHKVVFTIVSPTRSPAGSRAAPTTC